MRVITSSPSCKRIWISVPAILEPLCLVHLCRWQFGAPCSPCDKPVIDALKLQELGIQYSLHVGHTAAATSVLLLIGWHASMRSPTSKRVLHTTCNIQHAHRVQAVPDVSAPHRAPAQLQSRYGIRPKMGEWNRGPALSADAGVPGT